MLSANQEGYDTTNIQRAHVLIEVTYLPRGSGGLYLVFDIVSW